jgi:uncharacterized protein YndB with AHSA1/START domain
MPDTSLKTITAGTDIARGPHEVWQLLTDPARIPEWQPDVREAGFEEPADVHVGSRGHEVRHVMGADRRIGWEVTEFEPDHRYGVRGVDGPVRAHISVDLRPIDDGAGTHLEYGIGFEGHGIGKLIAPLARRGATKDVPQVLARLKQRLESAD